MFSSTGSDDNRTRSKKTSYLFLPSSFSLSSSRKRNLKAISSTKSPQTMILRNDDKIDSIMRGLTDDTKRKRIKNKENDALREKDGSYHNNTKRMNNYGKSFLVLVVLGAFVLSQRNVEYYHLLKNSFDNDGELLALSEERYEIKNMKDDNVAQRNHNKKKILVGYSGPTSMDKFAGEKNDLYLRNFDFFLRYGLADCHQYDVVIGITNEVAEAYSSKLQKIHEDYCLPYNHSIYIIRRINEDCHDLDTVYNIFYRYYNATAITNYDSKMPNPRIFYDYFVYINCGMTGPSPSSVSMMPYSWLSPFISPLSATKSIKMTGLSLNCFRKNLPHIQSMVYALSHDGINIILNSSSAIFDCRKELMEKPETKFSRIVSRYEKGMSLAIIKAGYGLTSIMPNVTTLYWYNRTNCTSVDSWNEQLLKKMYHGRYPTLDESYFFKTSRLLPPNIAESYLQYSSNFTPTWHAK